MGKSEAKSLKAEGWHGWDEYAAFYDWENARTLGRRDIHFWQRLARQTAGRILELGTGTGRVLVPIARVARSAVIGVDRSEAMLGYARRRLRGAAPRRRVALIRGDIRALPIRPKTGFDLVIAAYGILQSLVTDADLVAALRNVSDVLAPNGLLGIDIVPDLSQWSEYRRRIRLRGSRPGGRSQVTLIESVQQDRRRGRTVFEETFVERHNDLRKRRQFTLTFRTLSIPQLCRRLERVGLRVEAILGDYDGRPWDPRADVWLILARKAG